MSNNFERLVIGSAHEGAEGMFDAEETANELKSSELQAARQERGIFPDAQERYEQTLAEYNLEPIRDLENGIQYPTLDEWVGHRITYNRGTKFYPSFVRNAEGQVYFCKSQLGDNPDAIRGLRTEAEKLKDVPEEIHSPKLIEYIPPTDTGVSLLVTEAISVKEATVIPPKNWQDGYVPDIVRQMKIMEDQDVTEGEKKQTLSKKPITY